MAYIYKITDMTNDMQYIGYTKHKPETRFFQHVQSSKLSDKKSLLHKAMNKHGIENFVVETIEEHDDDVYLHTVREAEWIISENTLYPHGYNLQPGGEGNRSATKKRGVSVYDRNLQHMTDFSSILECSSWMGVVHPRVAKACANAKKGKACRVGDYYVCYKEDKPVVKNLDYLRQRNQTWLAAHNRGKKRSEHSLYMKERAKKHRDLTVYSFQHSIKGTFVGTRHDLKEFDESVSIGELGLLVKGKYKKHKGWSIQTR